MSQTIAELLDSGIDLTYQWTINIPETIDGEESLMAYRIWGRNLHDTAEDSVMLVRAQALEAMAPETIPYRGNVIDIWCEQSLPKIYSNEMRNCILQTPILYYPDLASIQTGTLETAYRKFFIFSYAELGGNTEDGTGPDWIKETGSRVFYNGSNSKVTYWLRTPGSVDNYMSISTDGSESAEGNLTATFYVIPCFCISTSMEITDELTQSNTYDLILPSAGEGISKINVFEVETFDVKDSESVQEISTSDYGIAYKTYEGEETEIDLTSFASSIIMNVNKGAMYFTITDSLDITVNSTETKVSFTIT